MTKCVAVLDGKGCYVGLEEVLDAEAAGRVEVPRNIDLPRDGSYKWDADARAFLPLGYNFSKPSAPPVAPDHAQFLLMRALCRGQPIPQEVDRYVAWYEQTILPQVEEKIIGDKRRATSAKGGR